MFDIILIIWLHFVGDFLLQNDKMAISKSTSLKWLAFHSYMYAIPFLLFGYKLAFVIGTMHGLVDFVTSKITKKLSQRHEKHWYYVAIGFDQAIHLTLLIWFLGTVAIVIFGKS